MTQAKRHPAVTEAISALLVRHPFFASLMMDLTEIVELPEGAQLPSGAHLNVAATDGKHIWIQSEKFANYTIDERIGLLCHEIEHIIFQHAARMHGYVQLGVGPDLKNFSTKKFMHAADYIINSHLTSQGFKLPLGSLQNSQVGPNDIVDEVYLKLPDDEDDKDDGPDQHEDAPADGNDLPHKAVVQAALKKGEKLAKMQGKGAAGLERFIEDFCTPKVSWQEHIRKAIISHVRGRDTYTWARPNRRRLVMPPNPYMPGRAGMKGPELAVEVDCSGSIDDTQVRTFLGEVSGILDEIQPSMIHLMYVDTAVHGDVYAFDDANDLASIGQKAGGGGGTDMTVVFREVEQRQLPVETVIVFTDGCTPFGEDTGIPTIWAITTPGITAPWGTSVHIPLEKADGE